MRSHCKVSEIFMGLINEETDCFLHTDLGVWLQTKGSTLFFGLTKDWIASLPLGSAHHSLHYSTRRFHRQPAPLHWVWASRILPCPAEAIAEEVVLGNNIKLPGIETSCSSHLLQRCFIHHQYLLTSAGKCVRRLQYWIFAISPFDTGSLLKSSSEVTIPPQETT